MATKCSTITHKITFISHEKELKKNNMFNKNKNYETKNRKINDNNVSYKALRIEHRDGDEI